MRILILRSCPLPRFYQAVNFLRQKFTAVQFTVLAQEAVLKELAQDSRFTEVILFPAPSFSPNVLSNEILAKLEAQKFDQLVIIYNNMNGAGYENVHEFAKWLDLPVYIYNAAGEYYHLSWQVKAKQSLNSVYQRLLWAPQIKRRLESLKNSFTEADQSLDAVMGEGRFNKIKVLRDSFSAVAQEINQGMKKEHRTTEIIENNPEVSIIIVNLNGRELLAECLPSLIEAIKRTGQEHEIIVVDNGSTDGSVEFVRAQFPQCKLITLDKNEGFPRACNLGAKQSSREVLVFLNNDLKVEPDFLANLLPPLARRRIFAVSAKAYVYGTQELNQGQTVGVLKGGYFSIKTQGAPFIVPSLYAMGGGCAVNRRKFEKLKGFDEVYSPGYFEDLDLCFRAWRRGWETLYVPAAVLHHKVNTTTKKIMTPRQIQVLAARNYLLFCWKNFLETELLQNHWADLDDRLNREFQDGSKISWEALAQALELLPEVLSRRKAEKMEGLYSFNEIMERVGQRCD